MLLWGTVIGVLSELIKFFSVTVIVPMITPVIAEEGGMQVINWVPSGEYTPYLPLEHFPMELCSLYLFFMPLGLLIKNKVWKKRLFALMFATGTIGGLMGIVLASITVDLHTIADYFTAPRVWQFFLYHSMIVVISLYLGFGEEAGLRFSDWKTALLELLVLDLPTFYLNSLFSTEVYLDNQVAGVTHRINFFSSYVNPLGLILTEKWQWMLYLLIRAVLASGTVILLYAMLRGKNRSRKKGGGD